EGARPGRRGPLRLHLPRLPALARPPDDQRPHRCGGADRADPVRVLRARGTGAAPSERQPGPAEHQPGAQADRHRDDDVRSTDEELLPADEPVAAGVPAAEPGTESDAQLEDVEPDLAGSDDAEASAPQMGTAPEPESAAGPDPEAKGAPAGDPLPAPPAPAFG